MSCPKKSFSGLVVSGFIISSFEKSPQKFFWVFERTEKSAWIKCSCALLRAVKQHLIHTLTFDDQRCVLPAREHKTTVQVVLKEEASCPFDSGAMMNYYPLDFVTQLIQNINEAHSISSCPQQSTPGHTSREMCRSWNTLKAPTH